MQEIWVPSLGWEYLLEEEMATHSSILASKIPQTEEPGRLQSMGHKESDMTEQLSTKHIKGKHLISLFYTIFWCRIISVL